LAGRSKLISSLLAHVQKDELLRAGDRVGVAVSGGADSVALLLLLLESREKLGIVLSVVHFNHRLRGKASDADEKFVGKLAAKHRLEFHCASADVAAKAKKERANLEDAARRARYDYFRALADSGACTHIAVAHTADDQAETVLAHILRGTGLAGLSAIHPVAGPVIRPLLRIRRAELRAYLRRKKQTWREDATNRDTKRMRARIRQKLLPLLEKQFQPNIVEHLATLAELAREDEAFLEALAEERMASDVQRHNGATRIALKDLFKTAAGKALNTDFVGDTESTESAELRKRTRKPENSVALSKRLIRRLVGSTKKQSGQLSAGHVEAVLCLARQGQTGSGLPLPGGVEVRKERDALVFRPVSKATDSRPCEFSYTLDLSRGSQEVPVPKLRCVFRFTLIDWPAKTADTNSRETVLDRERLRSPLVLRNWRPGDRFRPSGHQSAHKLKRLLSEKRISRWEREGWPVLTSGGILAWARGFPAAAEFAASRETRAGIVIAEEHL
jgi:tRNA(Ile)-lysidine synthase